MVDQLEGSIENGLSGRKSVYVGKSSTKYLEHFFLKWSDDDGSTSLPQSVSNTHGKLEVRSTIDCSEFKSVDLRTSASLRPFMKLKLSND